MKGFFGVIGSLRGSDGAVRGFRRLAYGRADAGLYATLATEKDGALQMELRPGGSFEVRWIPYGGFGPAESVGLFSGVLSVDR